MTNTYVISDTHFNHQMLVDNYRPFTSLEEMNNTIINNWNSVVTPEDTVYFLGDFAFQAEPKQWRDHLNGNIIFIKGNHDSNTLSRITALEMIWEGHTLLLLHNPSHATWFPTHDIVIHGHIHKSGGRTFDIKKGTVYANVNLEFHKYKPKLINEVVGMVVNDMEAEWISRKL